MYRGTHSCHHRLLGVSRHEDLSQIGELKETRREPPALSLGCSPNSGHSNFSSQKEQQGKKAATTISIMQGARQDNKEK
jgi:hypothetical protein